MRGTKRGLWLAVVLLAAPALAAGEGRGGWSVLSGSPVGASRTALQLQAGWPDLSLGGYYGVNDRLDAGLRFAFSYGQDGSLGYGPGLVPGFRFHLSARYLLLSSDVVRLGATFSPGFGLDYLPGLPTTRIFLPLQLVLGIAASEALALHVGLDMPVYVTPGTFGGLTFPILLAVGAEQHLNGALALTGDLRMGPALELTRPGAPARFAFGLVVGLAYRI